MLVVPGACVSACTAISNQRKLNYIENVSQHDIICNDRKREETNDQDTGWLVALGLTAL